MALSGLDSVVCYLRKVAPSGEAGDDGQLLARFAAGEEQAFAVLMNRYAGVVWGVCRRALSRQADAEDAFQATFLVLLRKAPALGRGGPLGPWLHRVASRTAVKARVRAARQTSREIAAAVPEAVPASDQADGELRAILDEEISRLPEKYRRPLVLCYLEGMTNEQAADRLGCPRGTILSRLSRAREQLRRRLVRRRRLDLPACLPGLLPAVPAALVESVLHGAVVRDGAFSTSVLSLAEGVHLSMSMHKLRLAALALLTLVAFAGAGVWAGRPAATGSAPPANLETAAQPPQKAKQKKTDAPTPAVEAKRKPKANSPVGASTGLEIRDALSKNVEFNGVDDPRITLIEVLDKLTNVYHVTFDINERAFEAESLNDIARTEVANRSPLPPMKTTLERVLRKVLTRVPASSGAVFLIRKDHIEITTRDAIRRELGLRKREPTKPLDDDADANRPALPPLVWEDLNKVPLEKALSDIAANTGVNVVLDPRVEKKSSAEVTTTLRNVPVETAVEVLADMAGLSVVYRDNIVYVTTPENAERLLKSKRWFTEPQRLARKLSAPGGGM